MINSFHLEQEKWHELLGVSTKFGSSPDFSTGGVRIIFAILLSIVTFSHTVNAVNIFSDSETKSTDVLVEVDAHGSVTAMEFLDDLDERHTIQLRKHILDSSFGPAHKNGRGVSSSTHLTFYYRPVTESDSGASLEIISMDSGPVAIKRTGIRYPEAGFARRTQGLLLVQARINSDGTPSDVRAAMQWPASSSLSRAAVRAVRQWRFEPDKVDGVAIASDVLT